MPASVVTLKELIKEPRNPERVETHLQILRQKLHDLLSMDFKSYPNTQWQQVAPTVLEALVAVALTTVQAVMLSRV